MLVEVLDWPTGWPQVGVLPGEKRHKRWSHLRQERSKASRRWWQSSHILLSREGEGNRKHEAAHDCSFPAPPRPQTTSKQQRHEAGRRAKEKQSSRPVCPLSRELTYLSRRGPRSGWQGFSAGMCCCSRKHVPLLGRGLGTVTERATSVAHARTKS